VIGREVAGIDLNPVRKAADASLVGFLQCVDESLGRCSTNRKFARMLPLRSSSTTAVMGWIVFANNVMSCRLPLSSIAKASRARSGTSRPSGPVTVA
jgi:hypothetical protein